MPLLDLTCALKSKTGTHDVPGSREGEDQGGQRMDSVLRGLPPSLRDYGNDISV